MPRHISNIKVWNEDLVKALRAREEQCRQQGSERQYLWRDAAAIIESVRNDIYKIQSNGKLVGMPRKLTTTANEECRAIIDGRRPILPEGYIPTSLDEQRLTHVQQENQFEQDPYLKKIKMRGGSYAILMAFHFSQSSQMTRQQICSAAQPFCDEQMEPNFHAGRPYGAWSSQKTLSKHGIIQTHQSRMRGGVSTYSLTDNGKRFLDAMLKKFPLNHAIHPGTSTDYRKKTNVNPSVTCQNPYQTTSCENFVARSKPVQVSPPDENLSKTNKCFEQDRAELLAWISEGGSGRQKKFQVGTARRENLSTLCDEMMEKNPGLLLFQKLDGAGSKCAIYISIMRKTETKQTAARALFPTIKGSKQKPCEQNVDCLPKLDTDENSLRRKGIMNRVCHETRRPAFTRDYDPFPSDSSDDECLDCGLKVGSKKKIEKCATSKVKPILNLSSTSCDGKEHNCKLFRESDTQQKRVSLSFEYLSSSDSDDDMLEFYVPFNKRNVDVAKLPLQSTKQKKRKNQKVSDSRMENNVIDLVDSDEDESVGNFDNSAPLTRDFEGQARCIRTTPSNTVENLSKDAEEEITCCVEGSVSNEYTLEIQIDSRERNRNSTPREMRIELTRHLTTGSLLPIWPMSLEKANVKEEQLDYGDFVFLLRRGDHDECRLPIAIERKRVSDLVQRSAKGDHWRQMQRIRDCCDHTIMLLEGDTKTANQFVVMDEDPDDLNPDSYAIADEASLFRFIGRAILSSSRIKFIQTNDEQASYRAIGATGLAVACRTWKEAAPKTSPTAKANVNKLYNLMNQRGIPWKIARRIAEEAGSIDHIHGMYRECSPSCRELLMVPLLKNLCSRPDEAGINGNATGWSKAIYSAMHTSLKDPTQARSLFEEYKPFAQNEPALLSALHSGEAPANAVRDCQIERVEDNEPRVVHISALPELLACLPQVETGSFFKPIFLRNNPLGLAAPTLVMQTFSRRSKSYRLCLHIFEGIDIVAPVQTVCESLQDDFVTAMKKIAREINMKCTSSLMDRYDRRVIVIRGLRVSLDSAAKKSGYKAEVKALIDFLFAELMVEHGIVVIHASRLSNSLDIVVREFAMACYLHQLLTQEAV